MSVGVGSEPTPGKDEVVPVRTARKWQERGGLSLLSRLESSVVRTHFLECLLRGDLGRRDEGDAAPHTVAYVGGPLGDRDSGNLQAGRLDGDMSKSGDVSTRLADGREPG